MRLSPLFTGALALVLAMAPVARAQDAPEPHKKGDKPAAPDAPDPDETDKGGLSGDEASAQKFPWNPFEKAAEGDWAVYQGSVHIESPMGKNDQPVTSYWKITKVDDDSVTVESSGSGIGAKRAQKTLKTFSRKTAPTLKELFELHKEGKVENLKLEDGKATIEGKDFAGKRISFTSVKGDGKMKTAMWVSPDVKGIGLFKMLMGVKNGGNDGSGITVKVELHLVGFGNNDKADWGKTYKEIAKSEDDAAAPTGKDSPKDAPKDAGKDAPKDTPKDPAAGSTKGDGSAPVRTKPCEYCGELRPVDSVKCPHCGQK